MSTSTQKSIAKALGVNPNINTPAEVADEINRRVAWIKGRMGEAGATSLVLGISGGIDSTTAGRLCQIAVDELVAEGKEAAFIAVRLPYKEQKDESDAQAALSFIKPSKTTVVNIAAGVDGISDSTQAVQAVGDAGKKDFIRGNIKARVRMVAQYAIANATNGLVVGTDHAGEAVIGYFTKGGDGFADIAPLAGLTKGQVRNIASYLGAPGELVFKTPTADLEELEPGKPDELAHGCSYDEIDAYLLGETVDDRVVAIIESTYRKTQHKRELPFTPV